ncbi:MAG: DUF6868 family protein [Planctomycetota bacterium]|jgi:hypothetical protein
MKLELLKQMLMWALIINFSALMLWFLAIACAHDLIYKIHSKWFKISVETFDKVHYTGMVFFKSLCFAFNVVCK